MRKRIARSVFILVAILVGWATAAIAQDAGRPRVSPEVPIELPEIEEEIETMSTSNYWISTTGRWDDTASWSLGHIPVTTELEERVTRFPLLTWSSALKERFTDRH